MSEKKLKKVSIRIKRKHKSGKMHLGSHVIGRVPANYDLNEAEQKELEGVGPKHWFEVAKPIEEKKPAKDKK